MHRLSSMRIISRFLANDCLLPLFPLPFFFFFNNTATPEISPLPLPAALPISRYVPEDAVLGLALLESAARAAGAVPPAVTGLLLVYGALLGRELSGRGRALAQHRLDRLQIGRAHV